MAKRNNGNAQSAASTPITEMIECNDKLSARDKAVNPPRPKKPSLFVQIKEQIKKKLPGWSKKEVELNNNHPIIAGVAIGLIVLAFELFLAPLVNGNSSTNTPANNPSSVISSSDNHFASATLLMPLSTRSGPSTQHDETGTYFPVNWENQTVQALGKFWENEIWWVLIDFKYEDQARYRVWTGSKRINVDITRLDEIKPMYSAVALATHDTFRGPGTDYAKAGIDVPDKTDVVVYGRENGFTEIEFSQNSQKHRLWVPAYVVH